jgi:hypothetical protein
MSLFCIITLYWKRILPLVLFLFLTACDNTNDLVDSALVKTNQNLIICETIDLSSDAFVLSDSEKSQLTVFDSLFLNEDGYKLPGNPDKESLRAFFEDLRKGYFQKDVLIDYNFIRKEYHTFTHAMDVMITTHALLNSGGAVYLNQGERASLVLAALGHDALHTGVNNSFLVQTNHPYFQELGENSLQEKRSANYVLMLLDKHGILTTTDGMDETEKNKITEARNLIEQSILWTDIKRHKEQMKAVSLAKEGILITLKEQRKDTSNLRIVGVRKQDLSEGINISSLLDAETRILMGSFILHCADISNPGKDWVKCERWAVLVMNEFFSQGDLQKKLGLKPSMNCDRNTVSVPGCQVGFGKYVIHDLYVLLKETVHDGGGYLLENFISNQQKWKSLHAIVEETGAPYAMKFSPPSREGGWMGDSKAGN